MVISGATPSINRDRLWRAHMDMAKIGPTPEGGSRRLALSAEDAQARALLEMWCADLGLTAERDALAAAAEIILANERIAKAAEPDGRGSASWIESRPNARGNVADTVHLHCDVRHADPTVARKMDHDLRSAITEIGLRRRVDISLDPYATFGPIVFDADLGALLRRKAEERQYAVTNAIAAAGHDSVFVAPLCPSAMLFIPCAGGVTHNPKEFSSAEQIGRGAQVLLDAVLELAG